MRPINRRGQAVAEMLLVLPLLILLVWSLNAVGRQQQAALELRHSVRALTLSQAQGLDPRSLPGPHQPIPAAGLLRLDLAEPVALAGQAELMQVHHELGLLPRGLVGTRLGATVHAQGQPGLLLQRQLLTVAMPPSAASASEVRRRIEQAPLTWANSGGVSTALASSRAASLARLDAAWGRPAIEPSWLAAWESLWGEQP